MAVARQSEVDQSVNSAPIHRPNSSQCLHCGSKFGVIPLAYTVAYFRFPGCFMPRHALVSMLAMVMGFASLPVASLADDFKPKTPETAFSGKLRPDILGISNESTAEAARTIFDSLF